MASHEVTVDVRPERLAVLPQSYPAWIVVVDPANEPGEDGGADVVVATMLPVLGWQLNEHGEVEAVITARQTRVDCYHGPFTTASGAAECLDQLSNIRTPR